MLFKKAKKLTQMPTDQHLQRDRLALAAILVVAAALRVIGLDSPLWYDEIVTLIGFVRLPLLEIVSTYTDPNNHLFYTLQAKGVISIFGENNWSLRLPAMIFGVAGIAAMWALARSVAGTTMAHATALIIAVSYHHVWFSQNARGYTGIMFWGIAATIIFIQGIKTPNWKLWTVYAVLVAAGLYTQLASAFLVTTHGVVYLVLLLGRYGRIKGWPAVLKAPASFNGQIWPIFGFALGGFITLTLYAPLLTDVLATVTGISATSEVDVMPEYQNPLWAIAEAVRTLSRSGWVMAVGAPAALVLATIGLVAIWRREPILAATIIIHIPLTFAILTVLSMRIWPRFFFVDLGFVFFAITFGVFLTCQTISDQIRHWLGWAIAQKHLFGLAVAMMVAVSAVLLAPNYQHPKQNLEGAHQYVEARRVEGDAVATMGWSYIPFGEYYEPHWNVVNSTEEFTQLRDQSRRTWLVFGFPQRTKRKYTTIMEIVDREFTVEKTFRGTLGDGNVVVYVSKDQTQSSIP